MAWLAVAVGFFGLVLRSSSARRLSPLNSTDYGPLPAGVEWLDQRNALSPDLESLMAGGQLWTALILAVHYNMNNAGATLDVGTSVKVRTPFSASSASPTWSSAPVLLERLGTKCCAVHLWSGQGIGGDGAIYVTFTPARQGMGDILTVDHLRRIWAGSSATRSDTDGITMSSYVKRKFDRLWATGFESALRRLITAPDLQGQKLIFAGVSHGATLAQIASYRFARKLPDWVDKDKLIDFATISWNSYLWTDAAGARAVHDTLRDRLLNVVLTQRQHDTLDRYMDSVSGYGFDQDFSPIPSTILLEAGCNRKSSKQAPGDEEICGDFLSCDWQQDCPPPTLLGKSFTTHLMKLHRAPRIQAAMKRATRKAWARVHRDV